MNAKKVEEHLEWIHGALQGLIDEEIEGWYDTELGQMILKRRDAVDPASYERAGKLAKALALLGEIWDELDPLLEKRQPKTPRDVVPTAEMLEAWKQAVQP